MLKILRRADEAGPVTEGRRAALQADIAALALEHPHVVRPTECGVLDLPDTDAPAQALYLLGDFVEGVDIHRFSARAAWSTILEVFASTLRALEALHDAGFIHGHLCAANVFVAGQGPRKSARILDAGLAYEVAETRRLGVRTSWAPEVLEGAPPDRRSDLYDLGCLFFECATRSPLFSGDEGELLAAHRHEPPRSPRTVKRSIPVAVEQLLDALLRKDPGDRPPSANAAIRVLNRSASKRFSVESRARGLSTLLRTRFQDREALLAQLPPLGSAVEGAEEPAPSVFLLEGALGDGRTRTLEAVRTRLRGEKAPRWLQPESPT
ncbi:MAG: hypothetical protein D6731_10860, partial [Planctomycetota bacterium]